MANDQWSSASAFLKRNTGTRSSGFTLTEVVVAILLTGIIVTGTFTALLVTKKTPEASTNRVLASLAARRVLDSLQEFQTASYGTERAGCPSNDDWCKGPAPNGGWALPGDSCQACALSPGVNQAGCGCDPSTYPSCPGGAGCYALKTGCTHDVTNLLPATMSGLPTAARMCYVVTRLDSSANQSDARPQVTVSVQWVESQE